MKKIQLSITIDPELCRDTRILAAIENQKMSQICEKAISQYVHINKQKIIDYYKDDVVGKVA